MTDKYFMGLDYGTQSLRCGIFDTSGRAVATSEKSHETFYPQPGRALQRPADWIDGLHFVIAECYKIAGANVFERICGISVCSTSSTVLTIGNDDLPLEDAILWMDVRAVDEAALINRTKHEVLKHCGGEASVEWIVPKMMWLRNHNPKIFEQAKLIVEQQDYINHYLTGKWCAALNQATCKSHYVEGIGGFNKLFFRDIGFDEFFDKANLNVVQQGEEIGHLRHTLCEKFNLRADVRVYQGCLDAYTNMLGLGVCNAGETGIVMGSSFVHLALSEKPVFGDGIWGPYENVLVPGLTCLEGGQISAASITKWFLQEFEVSGDNPYGTMADEAANIPIGCNGLITLDFFQGNRTPYKDPMAKGVLYGLTLSHTRGHIYRSILESIAFGTRNVLDAIEGGGTKIREIRGCGGVTLNKLWLQIIADVTEKPIVLTENSDKAGVLGGAITAAVGHGEFDTFADACKNMVITTDVISPSKEATTAYMKYYEQYKSLYENLKDMMRS